MRILYLSDRLSVRGGADQHLLQVVGGAVGAGNRVTVAHGRREAGVHLPAGVEAVRVKGLASAVASGARLGMLDVLLDDADVIHAQNVMNPVALHRVVATGRAVVTVQDHRVFCPGPGKTLPNGSACRDPMSEPACAECLPESEYRKKTLDLTRERLDALRGAHVVVLSRYMAEEMAAAGLDGAQVIPPWVEVGEERGAPGRGFLLAGRLVAHKAVKDAWRAWRAAATGEALRVAGAGPLESDLEGADALGWLGREHLKRELRGARALLFPSRWQEPFGILGVEALAQGTPVIVAESGGTGEWSKAGCIRVAPGEVGAMSEAIDRLANDRALALELGSEGRRAVAKKFDRLAVERRLTELYETLRAPAG